MHDKWCGNGTGVCLCCVVRKYEMIMIHTQDLLRKYIKEIYKFILLTHYVEFHGL